MDLSPSTAGIAPWTQIQAQNHNFLSFSFIGYGLYHISRHLRKSEHSSNGFAGMGPGVLKSSVRHLGQSFRSKTASAQAIQFLHTFFLKTVATHTHIIFRHFHWLSVHPQSHFAAVDLFHCSSAFCILHEWLPPCTFPDWYEILGSVHKIAFVMRREEEKKRYP